MDFAHSPPHVVIAAPAPVRSPNRSAYPLGGSATGISGSGVASQVWRMLEGWLDQAAERRRVPCG